MTLVPETVKGMGATVEDLVNVYTKQLRIVLELAVPAWKDALTQSCKHDIERVKKTALHIMLGDSYGSYRNALENVSLESLDERGHKLCLKFAKKALRQEKHSKWFVPNVRLANTRLEQDKFCPVYAKHKRFEDSPISYLTKLVQVVACAVTVTKCPLLTALFFFSPPGYFSPRRGYRRVLKFCMGF